MPHHRFEYFVVKFILKLNLVMVAMAASYPSRIPLVFHGVVTIGSAAVLVWLRLRNHIVTGLRKRSLIFAALQISCIAMLFALHGRARVVMAVLVAIFLISLLIEYWPVRGMFLDADA